MTAIINSLSEAWNSLWNIPPFEEVREAVLSENIDEVKRLLDLGAPISKPGELPLLFDALYHHTTAKIADLLISYGADVNGINPHGLSLLHSAVASNKPDFVRLLLENDVELDSKDSAGMTPLHHSIYRGSPEIIELLLRHGANIHERCKNNDGEELTIAHLAAAMGRFDIVPLLFSKKIDFNCEASGPGSTPLDFAIRGLQDTPESPENSDSIEMTKKTIVLLASRSARSTRLERWEELESGDLKDRISAAIWRQKRTLICFWRKSLQENAIDEHGGDPLRVGGRERIDVLHGIPA